MKGLMWLPAIATLVFLWLHNIAENKVLRQRVNELEAENQILCEQIEKGGTK